MTYPRTITAQLLDYDGTVVSGTPLANGFNVNWYDEEDGVGRGSVSLALSDSGAAELVPGRYVDCLVEGTSRFTFKIEGNPQYKIIAKGEEYEQIIIVSGPGWGCVFDEAATDPEYSLEYTLDTTWRIFSFASKLFPNAGGWGAAVEQAEYLEGVATRDCYGHAQMATDGNLYPAPIGFPWCTNPANLVNGVPTANYEDVYWIRTADQPSYVSSGYWFFRGTFTLADFTAVTFDVTGDNFFLFFLEGVPILGESPANSDQWMWQGWKPAELWLPAGTYTVAAAVYNLSFADLGAGSPVTQPACAAEGFAGGARYDNAGGLFCAMYVDGDTVNLPVHIKSSDDSWVSHYEEEVWPGWTPGQIIQQLIDEAVARGALTVYDSNTFSATTDSDSLAWRPVDATVDRAEIPMFDVEVGTSLLHALEELVREGYIHWHVQPGTLVLDVYRGRAPSSPSSSATFTAATNLMAFERGTTAPYANALNVQWEGGIVKVVDAAAVTAAGTRVEAFYLSDAATKAEAEEQGRTELIRRAQAGYPAYVTVVEPVSAADCPYEAFTVGDYVTLPDVGVVRVLAIDCKQDSMGYAVWTLELNQKLSVPERRQYELMRQLGGRQQVIRGVIR